MDSPSLLATIVNWVTHHKVLTFACTVLVVELAFRQFAPKSRAYQLWTKAFQTLGKFWTVVILSIVYFLSVAVVAAFMKLFGKDPLDRSLDKEASFWRKHEANPLEPHAAARHQF